MSVVLVGFSYLLLNFKYDDYHVMGKMFIRVLRWQAIYVQSNITQILYIPSNVLHVYYMCFGLC